ncbi:hypothetical protein VUJ46_17880 [Chryseobacterium sp. MYb264]|uniref:hypothetical protein n=1 Tax=Chryseobacterium sp. MYb264 TaxID=2745153 RepID=UPI002E148017|nr:hypothetical protein VUJ46_17880 [Chryseobacterium sp. MYb264]
MKKLTNALLVAVLVSCNQQKNETSSISKENISQSETTLSTTANQLRGNWISKPYIDHIKKSKAVYPYRKAAVPLFIQLDKNELLSGAATLKGFTDHEGGYDVKLTFDESKKEFIINGTSNDPTYNDFSGIQPNGENLEMIYKNKTDLYERFDGDIQKELRKILFEGNYTDKNSSTSISFSKDGKVNFKDYTAYQVIYDFADGTQNFDGILLERESLKDLYRFTITGNTLELQKMKESEESFKPEGEKYILIKK